MSSVPANCIGLLATTPTLRPSMRPKPQTIDWRPQRLHLEEVAVVEHRLDDGFMSYGALLLSGMKVSSSSQRLLGQRVRRRRRPARSSRLLLGR